MTVVTEYPAPADTLHYIPSPVTGQFLQFEDCTRCGITLPWDEERYCQECRSARPKRILGRCEDCGDSLDCDCCSRCDGCSLPQCEGCNDRYDRDDEGNDSYCGDCYRQRYCTECDEYAYETMNDEQLCRDCQVPSCTECDERSEELIMGECPNCRNEESEEGE